MSVEKKQRLRRRNGLHKRVRRNVISNSRSYDHLFDQVGDIRIHSHSLDPLSGNRVYHLVNCSYGDFLPINEIPQNSYYNGPRPSYGGAQIWWSDKDYKDSTGNNYGCGVIASTNLMVYLAQHFDRYSSLVERRQNSFSVYMDVADELWDDIRPYSGFEDFEYHIGRDPYTKAYPFGFGVTVTKLVKGIQAYAGRRGVSLEFSKIKAVSASDRQGANFIKKHLAENMPVLLLSLNNGIDRYEYHWVMITELVENQPNDADQITISTWGEMRSRVDFDELWNYGVFMENQYMLSVKV